MLFPNYFSPVAQMLGTLLPLTRWQMVWMLGIVTVWVAAFGVRSVQAEVLSVGFGQTCAIQTDGEAVCWGEGSNRPPSGEVFTQISAASHTCALKADGKVICWGFNIFGMNNEGNTNPPDNKSFIQVSSGLAHSCGLTIEGSISCWGDNFWVNNNPSAITPSTDDTFIQVSSGLMRSCGLTADGKVICWGPGIGENEWEPPTNEVFTQISNRYAHGCGLKADGKAMCWGEYFNLEDETPSEIPSAVDKTFTQISTGFNYTCGLKTDRTVVCWGTNEHGQASPPTNQTFTQMSTGVTQACGVTTYGKVICWGKSINDEDEEDFTQPADLVVAAVPSPDLDRDGMSNHYENQYPFLNPLDPADAVLDEDEDGFSNLAEHDNGTAPDDYNYSYSELSGGTIWIDLNANGVQDAGDTLRNGYIKGPKWLEFINTQTEETFSTIVLKKQDERVLPYLGVWELYESMPISNYNIQADLPAGWQQLNPVPEAAVPINDTTETLSIGVQPPLIIGFGIDGTIEVDDIQPTNYCVYQGEYIVLQPAGQENIMTYQVTRATTQDETLTFTTQSFQGTIKFVEETATVVIEHSDPDETELNPTHEVRNVTLTGNTLSFDIPFTYHYSAYDPRDISAFIDFEVTNAAGYTAKLRVCGHVPDTPLQDFDAGDDIEIELGETVQFKGQFFDPDRNDRYEIVWDFGDDSGAEGTLTPEHLYTEPGVYQVYLRLTNTYRYTDAQDSLTVTVREPVRIVATHDPMTVRAGDTFDMTLQFLPKPNTAPVEFLNLYMTYDPSQLQINRVTPSKTFNEELEEEVEIEIGEDFISFSATNYRNHTLTDPLDILYLNITALASNSDTTPAWLNFVAENTYAYDYHWYDIYQRYKNILINIHPATTPLHTASGQITDSLGDPLIGVTVQIGDKTAVTNAKGGYQLTGLSEGQYEIVASKDHYQFPNQICEVGNDENCRVNLQAQSLLALHVVTDPLRPQQGDDITYLVTIRNQGHQTATDMVLEMPLPADLTLIATETDSDTEIACEQTTCRLTELMAGESVKVSMRIANQATAKLLTQTVTLQSHEYPTQTVLKKVGITPHLAVEKVSQTQTITKGERFSLVYRVAVNTHAPEMAKNIQFKMELPRGYGLEGVTGVECNTAQLPLLTCDIGDMAIGNSRQVQVNLRLDDFYALGASHRAVVKADNYRANSVAIQTDVHLGETLADIIIAIDVTGSMHDEIDALETVMTQLQDILADAPTAQPMMAVVSFRDDIYLEVASTHLDEVLQVVEQMEAQGGGACAEASYQALELAVQQSADGGTLMLVTDAPPYPEVDMAKLVETINAKNLELVVIQPKTICAPLDEWDFQ